MRSTMLILALATGSVACQRTDEAKLQAADARSEKSAHLDTRARATPEPSVQKLYLDVHEVGPGKVTAEAVAQAHQKDLATEGKYGVDLKAYWVDQQQGKIYCLANAPSAEALTSVHREAHGMLPTKVMQVSSDNSSWTPSKGKKLFMDIHHFGPGKVDAQAVARAHAKDVAVQAAHDVRYLNYWLDAASGTVMCLTESPSAEASLAVHKEAHGLMPDSIDEVSEGR